MIQSTASDTLTNVSIITNITTAVVTCLATIALVFVTAWYARLTRKGTKAARKSAKISAAVLQEMRDQRLDSSQPLVVPRLIVGPHRPAQTSYLDLLLTVELRNIGNGPALNILAAMQLNPPNRHPTTSVETHRNTLAHLQAGWTDPPQGSEPFSFRAIFEPNRQPGPPYFTPSGYLTISYHSVTLRQFDVIQHFTIENNGNESFRITPELLEFKTSRPTE